MYSVYTDVGRGKVHGMLKVYGTALCPDCVECKYNLDQNGIEYEYLDITGNLRNLKAFLKLRDHSEVFADAKEKGYIGIPALVLEDGELILDWESYLTGKGIEIVHPSRSGASCGIDGKGC
jgi:glutaredoxin-related protein